MYNLTNGQIILIGVGGIESGSDCYEKIKSGAYWMSKIMRE